MRAPLSLPVGVGVVDPDPDEDVFEPVPEPVLDAAPVGVGEVSPEKVVYVESKIAGVPVHVAKSVSTGDV